MRFGMRNFFYVAVGTAVMSMAAATSQASVLIDDFSVGAFGLTANGTSGSITQNALPYTGLSGVIGGSREATLTRHIGTAFTISSNMNGFGGSGTPGAYIIEAQRFNGARATLAYGGNGPLNADMTVGGNDSFGVEFITADVGASVIFNIVSNGVQATQTLSTSGMGAMFFDFANFTTTTPGTINYQDIDAVEIIIDGLLAGDYTIALIQATDNPNTPNAIPSPAAVWGGAILLTGLLARRRRQRQN